MKPIKALFLPNDLMLRFTSDHVMSHIMSHESNESQDSKESYMTSHLIYFNHKLLLWLNHEVFFFSKKIKGDYWNIVPSIF